MHGGALPRWTNPTMVQFLCFVCHRSGAQMSRVKQKLGDTKCKQMQVGCHEGLLSGVCRGRERERGREGTVLPNRRTENGDVGHPPKVFRPNSSVVWNSGGKPQNRLIGSVPAPASSEGEKA